MHRLKLIAARPAVALAIALAFSAGIAQAQTQIKPGFNLFSPQDDVTVGQQSAVQAEQQLPILNDSQANAYVNRIGQRLAANAGGPEFQYQFRVINASDINAFALPGGFVYVNRGVLDQARDEGEVAGVLAHEISHVSLRHGTHQASKAYLAQAGISILGGLLGGKVGGNTAQIINAVGGVGLNALFLKYSRDLETQADVRGAQIMAASGYNPNEMVSFFQTLERADTSKKTNWLSDHPAPPDRITRIQKEIQMLRATGNSGSETTELRNLQARMRSNYGSAPTSAQIAQGATSPSGSGSTQGRSRPATQSPSTVNVPAPSTTMETYVDSSRLFSISVPSNWQLVQRGNGAATFAPPGGVVDVNGQGEIAYGAIVAHYSPFGNATTGRRLTKKGSVYENATVQDATNDLLATIERSSPHLKLISGSKKQVRVNGNTALMAGLRGINPNTGIRERVTVVTRQLPDAHLVYMLFITPDSESSRYGNVLNAMAGSLQVSNSH